METAVTTPEFDAAERAALLGALDSKLGGKVAFGWRVGHDGELVAVPEEQEAIKRMKRLKATFEP